MQLFSRHSLPSIRSKTATLVLACLAPSLIAFSALTYDSFSRERSNLIKGAQRMAQSLIKAVERDLATAETAARALASSPSLASDDLAGFHAQARSVLSPDLSAVGFVLSDRDGKPLLNTRYALGRQLPPNPNAERLRTAFASGEVGVSNLARVDAAARYIFSVDVPVRVNGEVRYVLSAQLDPDRLARLCGDLGLPKDWLCTVYDRDKIIVARSMTPNSIGLPARKEMQEAIARADNGVVEMTSRSGLRVLAVYSRSKQIGWAGSIAVPRDAAYAAVRGSLSNVFLVVALLLAFGFVTAWIIGGQIGRSVRALRAPAVALGQGREVEVPPLGIREAAEVSDVLKSVEQELNSFRSNLEERVRERTVELENANALIKNVYATAPAGLAMLDADLRVVLVNDYLAAINDRPVAEHIGKTLPELLGPAGVEFERAYRQVRDTGEPLLAIEDQGEVPSEPGVNRHWIASYYPVFNNDGKLVGVSGLVLDVSERKNLADQLRDVSEQFHVLYEMSGDAHMLITPTEGFVSGNRAAAAIFGCDSIEQLLSMWPIELSPEFQPDGSRSDEKSVQFIEFALERGSHQFEWVHRRVDGTLFHADVMLTSLNAAGKSVVQATIRDISDRIAGELRLQSLNEQLAHALDRAERASSAKSEFLANMSHEIRTPMNAIMGLARLLEESPLARRERSYVAKIKMSTRSLLGILNDVLDFSKIEAGQLKLEYTAFRLDQVLDSIAVLLAPNAAAKGIELVFAVAPDVPEQLVGDPMRLEQVLLNLVSNAIKFTEQGEVVVSIRDSGKRGGPAESSARMTLLFCVRDTGIGIAEALHAHMFDAFSQADSSTSRRFGGTGLGLTICRRLVGLMGGTISVASEPGKGAEFTFDAPFDVLPGAPLTTLPDLPGLAERVVLVVDDNGASAEAIAAQLTAFGWRADVAASGDEALDLLRAAKGPRQRYDYAFVDAQMAGMDGVSLLTYARADHSIDMPRTALMVAEHTREQLALLAEDLRLDATLSKPVTREALVASIVELHTGRVQHGSALAQPLAGQLEGIYVLLVEDNQLNQEVANYLLLHAGAAVDIASDGRIAVDMLREAPTRYDAVLMDIQMPVMNGYEATEAIRSMGLKDLPIIAMTANVMEDDRARAIDAGMDGHISKPIDVDNMLATLVRVTSGGAQLALREPERGSHRSESAASEAPLPAAIAGIDLRATLPRFGGNFANFVTLFKRFEQSQGSTLAEVRQLLRSGEREAPVALVHRLRGVAANLGATAFAALALDFEHALRQGTLVDLMERLDVLDVELARLLAAARRLDMPALQQAPALASDAAHLDDRLADLLALLQNNNLKALSAFDALRTELVPLMAPEALAALAEAIATLGFPSAAQQVGEVLNRKVML